MSGRVRVRVHSLVQRPGHSLLIPCLLIFVVHDTGPIPEELGKLTALERLFLGDNILSGENLNSVEATCMNPA